MSRPHIASEDLAVMQVDARRSNQAIDGFTRFARDACVSAISTWKMGWQENKGIGRRCVCVSGGGWGRVGRENGTKAKGEGDIDQ